MKHYEEIANRVLKRRDEYVARQNQKRKTVMKITSVTCALALVALAGFGVWWFGGQSAAPVAEENATKAPTVTTAPTENDGPGIGGDENACTIHSCRYHRLDVRLLRKYPVEPYEESYIEADGEDYENIVGYVEYYNIPREEFIELMKWDAEKLDELVDDREGKRYCPYTYNQFLDAIYGDDAELAAWVFAPERTWPEIEPVEDPAE